MSQRNLVYFLFLFVILFLIYLIVQKHSRPPGVKEVVFVELGSPKVKDAERLEVYLLREPEKKFVFEKKDGRWVIVSDYLKPAKRFMVERILRTFTTLKGEPRVKGRQWFSRFGLDEKTALRLDFYKENEVFYSILLGKRGERWQTTFVRFPDSEEVYLVPVNLLAIFEVWKEAPELPEERNFLDLKVVQLSPEELKEVSFFWEGRMLWRIEARESDNGTTWVLYKEGQKPKELDRKDTEKVIREHLIVIAEDVVAPSEFKRVEGKLLFETPLGKKGEIKISEYKEKNFCLFKYKEFVYKVKKNKVEVFKKMF